MGFNQFPSFRRKAGASVSEESYPNTKKFRDHHNLIEDNAAKSTEHFKRKFEQQVLRMFDVKNEGRVDFNLLTEDEVKDIQNFVAHAGKRIAAGAITSGAYHDKIQKGRPGAALDEFAPTNNGGHDAMHSMMAYARTEGASLVPAYTKIEDLRTLMRYQDLEANLEEAYVVGFSRLGEIERKLIDIRDARGLTGDELVLAAVESWEDDLKETQGWDFPPNYLKENRSPEFVNIVRNLLHNFEQGEPSPNFEVHEFQRILRPLLERLRTSPE